MKKGIFIFALMLLTAFSGSNAQTPLSIGANVGINSPMSEFSDVYKSGFSGEAVLLYSTPAPGLDISLTIGYNSFSFKNDYFTDLVKTKLPTTGVDGFNPDWTATDIPVMVGGRFEFPAGGFSPYVTGEIGLHFMSFSDRFNGTRIIGTTSDPYKINNLNDATESASETGFGFALGGGFLIPFAPKISLDIGVKYNYGGLVFSKQFEVFRNSTDNFTNPELKNISFITARGGIIISL